MTTLLERRRIEAELAKAMFDEMSQEIGAVDLGAALSCNRDGSLCEGYDPRIKMSRTETIIGGHKRCNFRFTLEGDS